MLERLNIATSIVPGLEYVDQTLSILDRGDSYIWINNELSIEEAMEKLNKLLLNTQTARINHNTDLVQGIDNVNGLFMEIEDHVQKGTVVGNWI